MPRYALASHVFACLDQDCIVLLDLKQDRYFSFEAPGAPDIENLAENDQVAERLLERGLLIHSGDATNDRPFVAVPAPTVGLVSDRYEENPPRSMGYVSSFVRATAMAAALLRIGSLERAVRRVRTRNARRNNPSSLFDPQRARELVAVFTDLRPFLFTSREACLFESLVLIEFMARYSFFPAWVFGVRARPFAAHCWVQQGDTVLNDTVEHVTRYTPIMTA